MSKNYFNIAARSIRKARVGVPFRADNNAMNFWRPNIDRTGRIFRALTGVVVIGSGVVLMFAGWLAVGGAALVFGAFCLFEASRGWCIARACGLKTRH